MATYEVNSSPLAEEAPVSSNKLSQIIDGCLPESDKSVDLNSFTESILRQLNVASTLHKFIVNTTCLNVTGEADVDLKIENCIGGSWNKEKDGLYNHKAQVGPATYLITVIWIAK